LEFERIYVKRAYLSIRLVFEALIGVALLFNCGSGIVISPYRNLNIANIVGILLGIGLAADAFRVRRMLNQLDAKNDPPQD
jgi:hypothetical protein